jgi:hypothetical protein
MTRSMISGMGRSVGCPTCMQVRVKLLIAFEVPVPRARRAARLADPAHHTAWAVAGNSPMLAGG